MQVAEVEEGSDAATKGINVGDIVTHVNGEAVNVTTKGHDMPQTDIQPRTVEQAAAELNLSRATIRAWIAQRRLGHVRLGRLSLDGPDFFGNPVDVFLAAHGFIAGNGGGDDLGLGRLGLRQLGI